MSEPTLTAASLFHEEANNYRHDEYEFDQRRYVKDRSGRYSYIFHLKIEKCPSCIKATEETSQRKTQEPEFYGTCFLASMTLPTRGGDLLVNTNTNSDQSPDPLYLLTAGHNLFCRKHGEYMTGIDLISAKPLPEGPRDSPKRSLLVDSPTYYRVPDEYRTAADGHTAKLYDFGVICLSRDSFIPAAKPDLTKHFLAVPSSLEKWYGQAFVCGYPSYVLAQPGGEPNIPPTVYPTLDGKKTKDKATSCEADQHCVVGAMFEVPEENSLKSRSPESCGSLQRKSAGVFSFPQNHFDEKDAEFPSADCEEALFRHYIDTSEGQSGSPLYILEDEQCKVIGVHVGVRCFNKKINHKNDCNVAVKLNNSVLQTVAGLITPEFQAPSGPTEDGEHNVFQWHPEESELHKGVRCLVVVFVKLLKVKTVKHSNFQALVLASTIVTVSCRWLLEACSKYGSNASLRHDIEDRCFPVLEHYHKHTGCCVLQVIGRVEEYE